MVSNAEEVTEKISEYGTLDEEEIQSIKENAERKAQNTEEPKETGTTVTSELIQEVQDEATTEIKKFVICPKCGEKIWL